MIKKLWNFVGRVGFWCAWPALFMYLGRSERTRVLIICVDQVVVLKNWLGNGQWGLPGGGLHKGEDSRLGAIREVHEETGISLQPAQLQPLMHEIYRDKGFRFSCHYFVAELPKQQALRPQLLEVSDLQWLSRPRFSRKNAAQDVMRALSAYAGE